MFRKIQTFFNRSKHERLSDPGSDSLSSDQLFNPSKRERQAEMFHELLSRSKRISRYEFADNFGGIADDVVEMLDNDQARKTIQEARESMEEDLSNPLRKVEFGSFSKAKELKNGEVAAIDGTFALPMQKYSTGQAICVGIGSLSHRRPMQDSLHYWSSKVFLSEASDTDDFIAREKRGLFGTYPTAYLRYYEIQHCLEIEEPYLFLDGPLVDESLIARPEGVQLYNKLFQSRKQTLGVMKNMVNPIFTKFARALKPGEIYVVETLEEHLNQRSAARNRYVSDRFKNSVASNILRGVFKPRNKAFGFEAHKDHLEDMLHIMAADCQMNNAGHEIPFLLNRIDEEVRKNFNPQILKDRIAFQMATHSEELFFEETNERSFRSPR